MRGSVSRCEQGKFGPTSPVRRLLCFHNPYLEPLILNMNVELVASLPHASEIRLAVGDGWINSTIHLSSKVYEFEHDFARDAAICITRTEIQFKYPRG